MSIASKLLGAALAAALILGLAGASASANRSLSIAGGGRAILAVASGERKLTFIEGGLNIITSATLHGSVHTSILKTAAALAGVINRVVFGPRAECRTNALLTCELRGLVPAGGAHLRFVSFTGTLPRITSVTFDVVEFEYLKTVHRMECLFRGTMRLSGRAAEEPGGQVIEALQIDESRPSSLFRALREEFGERCTITQPFSGTFALSPSIVVRLH